MFFSVEFHFHSLSSLCPFTALNNPPHQSTETNDPQQQQPRVSSAQQRQLPSPPKQRQRSTINAREPPPPYWASSHQPQPPHQSSSSSSSLSLQFHNIPIQLPSAHRRRPPPPPPRGSHRTAQQISLTDTDSDDDDEERERRFRIFSPPRPKNEILLGELVVSLSLIVIFQLNLLISTDEDLFCPDLVRNCKSLPVIEDDQDYIEIEELASKLSLHNEIGLPLIDQSTHNMGQSVSLRRPKISLTWVLREQQNQVNKKQNDWNSEKILFRKNSKSKEKLFSEMTENLTEFRGKKSLATTRDERVLQEKNEIAPVEVKRKTKERCCGHRHSPTNADYVGEQGLKKRSLSQANLSTRSTATYSDPSIYITSAQSDTGALVKRRRRKKRAPRIGYNIKNVDDFLSKCSLSSPANIPVVLSNASILYQTRTGYNQIEVPIPLGMIVNSIFLVKSTNQNWLYVQTPHGEEGYVNYNACMPLGIIPNQSR